MVAVQLTKHGDPEDSLSVANDRNIPGAGANEVLIKVSAASVNPIDCRVAAKYGWTIFAEVKGVKLPVILGRDFAGEVISVGEDVAHVKIGDRVWGAIDPFRREGFKHGTHSQYIIAQGDELLQIPPGLTDVEAASLPYVFLTTWNSICNAAGISLESLTGKKVFINGGSGGVGSMSIQLMKAYGAYVAVSCSSKNIDFVKVLGADETIAYDKEGLEHLKDADLVYNLVPDEYSQKQAYETLKRAAITNDEANLITSIKNNCLSILDNDTSDFELEDYKAVIAAFDKAVSEIASGKPAYITIVSPMMKLTNQKGFHSGMREFTRFVLLLKSAQLIDHGRCYHYGFFAPGLAGMMELNKLVEMGKIKPNVSHRYPIDKVVDAFRQVSTGHTRGKVVLEMPSSDEDSNIQL